MQSTTVNGVSLEYEVCGTPSEPLVLSHCSVVAEAFVPLMDQSALGAYQRIRYHRRGYAGSSRTDSPCSIADQAADLAGLLDYLGMRRAHVVGHSSSALIALQLATDRPDLVGTLVLMEPPLYFRLPGPASQSMSLRMATPLRHYREGDREGAVDAFFSTVFGPGSHDLLEHVLPGSFAQAVRDADIFFDIEFPDMLLWPFGAVEARRITAPVLSLAGAESNPMYSAVEQLLREWLPQLETARVPGVNHLLHLKRPQPVAETLVKFLARHPLH